MAERISLNFSQAHSLSQAHSFTYFFTDALKFIFKWKLLGVIHINSFTPIRSSYQARYIPQEAINK